MDITVTSESNIFHDDQIYVRLAREIAWDFQELPAILKRYNITEHQWARISADKYFQTRVAQEIISWNETTNTHERSKLKAAAVIEEWLPEAHLRLHDEKENLPAKVALANLIAKIAGLGVQTANVEGGTGEKFTVNINLGEQKSITIEKPMVDVTPNSFEQAALANADLGQVEVIKKW
jgi:hypothetical protein